MHNLPFIIRFIAGVFPPQLLSAQFFCNYFAYHFPYSALVHYIVGLCFS